MKEQEQYELSPFPKDVVGILTANCVQRYVGEWTYELEKMPYRSFTDEIKYQFLKRRAPAYKLSEDDKEDQDRFFGDFYAVCNHRAEMFMKDNFQHEILKFNKCVQICDEKHASKYKVIFVFKRSMCRRQCEDKLDLTLKEYMRDGKFPKMQDILKM